jgi:hypothetical protein
LEYAIIEQAEKYNPITVFCGTTKRYKVESLNDATGFMNKNLIVSTEAPISHISLKSQSQYLEIFMK